MRHKKQRYSLNRFSSYRKATVKALTRSVLLRQRVITTAKKAKAARVNIEKVISLAKKEDLTARRKVYDLLNDHALVKTLFNDIAPLFSKRQSGFTRIILWKKRRGDNAQLVVLELTEQKKVKAENKQKQAQKPIEPPKEKTQPAVEKEKAAEKEKKKFLGGLKTFFKKEKQS